ncbi:MAG: hypothetical protein HYU69_09350 [Bacteroidetes bacterium]|nr:hypothetical protein [Bacteroidota bacterium]
MIFTKFNLLAFFILLVINIIPVYRSHRRKKYAYFSTKIFIPIFASYWIMLLIYFQTFDFTSAIPSTSKPGAYKRPAARYETTFSIKTKYENDIKYKINKLNRIMTIAAIQCIIVLLLSAFGIAWLNDRIAYYVRVIFIFSALLVFCIFIIRTGGISGYETITQ